MSCAIWLYCTHCITYNLKLAVLDGIKEKKKLSSIKEMLHSINKHYHYSPTALRVLKEHAEFLERKEKIQSLST